MQKRVNGNESVGTQLQQFRENAIAIRFKMFCFGFRSFRESIQKSPFGKIFYTHQKYKLKHLTLLAGASVFKKHTYISI